MTHRTTAYALCGLTICGLVIGAIVMSAPSVAALVAAECVKFASAVFSWKIATLGNRQWLARVGAVLMAIAGFTGIGAILAESHMAGSLVSPIALSSLLSTSIWGLQIGRDTGDKSIFLIAFAWASSVVATMILPPVGILAALLGLIWWATVARRVCPASQ